MKGCLSVGCQLKFWVMSGVDFQIYDTVSVGLKWNVECRANKSDCPWRAALILG